MLSSLRELLRSKVASILIGLLIVSLAAFGITNIFGGGLGENIARAGDQRLSMVTFSNRVDNFIARESQRTGRPLRRRDIEQSGQLDQLFRFEMIRLLQMGYMDKLGAVATNRALRLEAEAVPRFTDPQTGKFNPDLYVRAFNSRSDLNAYERERRENLSIDYLQGGLTGAVAVPEVLALPFYDLVTSRLEIEYFNIPATRIPEPEPVTDADIEAFYADNVEALQYPEQRAISVLSISPEDYVATVDVPEDDIVNLYEAQKTRLYAGPENRRLTYLTFGSRAVANQALAQLSVGTPVADLPEAMRPTATSSLTAQQDELPNETIANDAFGPLSGEGAVFGPYPAGESFQLVIVEEIITGEPAPLEDVREEIRADLAERAARTAALDAADEATRLLGQGQSLEAIAAAIGAPVISFVPVTEAGRTLEGRPIGGLLGIEGLMGTALSLPAGEISDPIDLPNAGYVLVRVDRIVEPFTPQLSEIRDLIEGRLNRQRAGEAVQVFASELQESLRADSTSMAAEAARFETAIASPANGITRSQPPADLGSAALSAAFGARPGNVLAIPNSRGGVTVMRVGEVTRVPELQDQIVPELRAQLREPLLNNMIEAAFEDIQDTIDMTVNDNAYAAFRAEAIGDQ